MKYCDLNRFGIVSAHINDMTILVSPANYQIGHQQETQHEHDKERFRPVSQGGAMKQWIV